MYAVVAFRDRGGRDAEVVRQVIARSPMLSIATSWGRNPSRLEELRRRGDRSLHHISTTRGAQTRVFTVAHVYPDLAADLPKYTDVLLGPATLITLPR